MRWLRQNKNTIADTLSRFVDLDDWGIHRLWYSKSKRNGATWMWTILPMKATPS